MRRTAIIGAGSWGTALAALWATDGREISLWGNDPQRIARVRKSHENPDYLPGVRLASNVDPTHDFADCGTAALIVFVTPCVVMRDVAAGVGAVGLRDKAVLLRCTQGSDH